MPEMFHCEGCHQDRNASMRSLMYANQQYCNECTERCAHCDNLYPNCIMHTHDGERYCHNCMTACNNCGDMHLLDDMYQIYGESGDYICINCRDNHYRYCDVCDQLVHDNDIRDIWNEDTEEEIMACDYCVQEDDRITYDEDNDAYNFSNHRRTPMPTWATGPQTDRNRIFQDYLDLEKAQHRCPQCNKVPDPCPSCLSIQANAKKKEELSLWIYDTQLCNYHAHEHNRFKSLIYRMPHEHPYLYYGIELEVVFNPTADKPKVVHNFIEATKGLFVAEYDSSVDRQGNGAEFISRPLSYKAWTSPRTIKLLEQGFEVLKNAGAKVIQPENCGLHVHMSMVFFEHNTKKKKKDIKDDIDWFFQVFQKEIEQISNRPYTEFCYAKKDRVTRYMPMLNRDCGVNLKMTIARGNLPSTQNNRDNHHYAIVGTDKTIEVRTFRSTLDIQRILAILQFCRAIAHAARNMKITEDTTFNDIISCKEGDELTALVHKLKLDTSKKFATEMEV